MEAINRIVETQRIIFEHNQNDEVARVAGVNLQWLYDLHNKAVPRLYKLHWTVVNATAHMMPLPGEEDDEDAPTRWDEPTLEYKTSTIIVESFDNMGSSPIPAELNPNDSDRWPDHSYVNAHWLTYTTPFTIDEMDAHGNRGDRVAIIHSLTPLKGHYGALEQSAPN